MSFIEDVYIPEVDEPIWEKCSPNYRVKLLDDPVFKECMAAVWPDTKIKEAELKHIINGNKKIFNLSLESFYDAINIIKAAFASGASYADVYARLATQFEITDLPIGRVLTLLSILYGYLGKFAGVEQYIEYDRNFIKEAVAEHLGITLDAVKDSDIQKVTAVDLEYASMVKPVENWDAYFLKLANDVASNSKCLSRRIGAVMVEDKSVICTGYNGPPRGVPMCHTRWESDLVFRNKYYTPKLDLTKPKCPRHVLGAKSGEMLSVCLAAHAEENAILNAARMGIKTKGTTLYLSCGVPCFRCLIKIINAGVKEVVVTNLKLYDTDGNSEFLLNNSNVKIRLYDVNS